MCGSWILYWTVQFYTVYMINSLSGLNRSLGFFFLLFFIFFGLPSKMVPSY